MGGRDVGRIGPGVEQAARLVVLGQIGGRRAGKQVVERHRASVPCIARTAPPTRAE